MATVSGFTGGVNVVSAAATEYFNGLFFDSAAAVGVCLSAQKIKKAVRRRPR